MSPARAALVSFLALAYPTAVQAQGLTIDHKQVACIVAGKYPRLNACFTPTGEVVKPRVNFKMKNAPAAYYTEMKSDMPCHVGYLPRPKKELIGQEIEIWLEGMDRAFNPARTPEYTAKVVGSEAECKDLPVAPWVSNAAVTVFPTMAPGFVASAAPGLGLLAAGGGAALLGTGAYLATRDDDPPPPVSTPTPAPVPTPTPTPTPTPPVTTPVVDCTIRPRSGAAPLTVSFSAVVSGFTGPVDFRWDFGDGSGSTDRDTTHTYTAPGVFRAIVTATGGGLTATCDRNVSVSPTPDPPPVVTRATLTVTTTSGKGLGSVTSDSPPGGINCPSDCTETYDVPTTVTLRATPQTNSFFAGWSGGGCTGTAPCTLTLTADTTVNAVFEPIQVTLDLTCSDDRASTTQIIPAGSVSVAPSALICNSNGRTPVTVSNVHSAGSTLTIIATAVPGTLFTDWGGACSSLGRQSASPSTCMITVPPPGPVSVTVHFTGTGTPIPVAAARPAPSADADGVALAWRHQLEAAGAVGHVLLNGATTVDSGPGLHSAQALGRPGENRIQGRLTRASGGAGTWRFELGSNLRLEPGSIRILSGEPVVVTGDTVVFRVRGQPGEQVAFTFRLKR